MLRPRVIPCLLIHNNGLVKTVQFSNPKYIGDPLNAVRIFNEKEVDELMVIDIDATPRGVEPNYKLIQDLASECRMPLCYGGGVTSADQAAEIISSGVEKVSISAAAFQDFKLIEESSRRVGSQSVVVVFDVKKTGLFDRRYGVFTHNGRRRVDGELDYLLKSAQLSGAGEIIVNNIDRDGIGSGYDLGLLRHVDSVVSVPLTFLGGVGSVKHFEEAVKMRNFIGLSAGSFFVMTGKYKAVLIQYLNSEQRATINNMSS